MMPRLTSKKFCLMGLIVGTTVLIILILIRQRNLNYRVRLDEATNSLRQILGSKSLKQLVLPDESTVLMEPDHSKTGCEDGGNQILAFIVVMSSPLNRERRDVLRSVMGNFFDVKAQRYSAADDDRKNCDDGVDRMTMMFLAGVTTDGVVSAELAEEFRLHGDMIVDNVIDTYYNLTIKSLRMYKYFEAKCPRARYLVRLDDDVYLNIENLRKYLTKKCAQKDSTLMSGYKVMGIRNEDDPYHKHFIPRYLWPDDQYPDFIYGFLYAMGRDAVTKVYEEGLKSATMFHIDDLFLSGILGSWKLRMGLEFMPTFVTWGLYDSLMTTKCAFADFVGGHSLDAAQRICLHHIFNSANFYCGAMPMFFYC